MIVYKYVIPLQDGPTIVEMQESAKVLCVGLQRGIGICLWTEVPSNQSLAKKEHRTFILIGTGHNFHPPKTYVGTIFDGPFVWHVYEVTS